MSLAPHRGRCRVRGKPLRRALGIALISCTLQASGAPPAEGPNGRFSLPLTDPVTDRTVNLEPVAPLLHLVFFATWCPPCRDELSRLAEIEARWRDGGYRLVIIAVPARHSAARLTEFASSRPVPGTLLFDSSGVAQTAFQARQIPTHVLVDGEGKVLMRAPALDSEVEERIENVLVEYARGE